MKVCERCRNEIVRTRDAYQLVQCWSRLGGTGGSSERHLTTRENRFMCRTCIGELEAGGSQALPLDVALPF